MRFPELSNYGCLPGKAGGLPFVLEEYLTLAKCINVAGRKGMVGSALVRQLNIDPNIEFVIRTRSELNLTNQAGRGGRAV